MSLPTVYQIFNDNGEAIGRCQTHIWSWYPIVKTAQPEAFAVEVAGLLLDDIAVYCAGQQANAPNPKFKLEDVASLTSAGGTLSRAEFPDALKSLAVETLASIGFLKDNHPGAQTEQEIADYFEPRANAAFALRLTFNDIIAAKAAPTSATPIVARKPAP
jgi:hypothetical protein